MRSDNLLNTGMTSASLHKAERTRALRQKARQEKEAKQRIIHPAAELIINELDKELENTKLAILKTVNPTSKDEDVKSTLSALNLYDASMKKIKFRLQNVLKMEQK